MYMELLNSSEASFDNTRNETISLRISHEKKFGTITGRRLQIACNLLVGFSVVHLQKANFLK